MATAFERLFIRIAEITAIMESEEDKETAVKRIIAEMPEFADMKPNTVSGNITNFPFIFHSLVSELTGIRADLESIKKETEKEFQAVIDNLNKENELLKSELDNLRQNLDNRLEITQELDRVRKENETLRHELDNLRHNLDKEVCNMDIMTEIQDLKNRVTAIEMNLDKRASKLDKEVSILDNKLSNQEIPEYVDTWKVTIRDGYYKLYKTINKKLIWIHLGRVFNPEKAQRKIQERLSKLDKNLDKLG